ncbi:MAG TPA: hypothetical protein VE444_06420 [Gaiellaceae bacterium]|nr:hypothetical protein [Gaiellaceae bacterium]
MQPGAIIGEAWRLYKEHWKHFLPIALVIFLILAVVSLLLALVLGALGAVLGALIGIIGIFWLQGALVEAVADVRDGLADLSIGDTFRRVQPRLPSIIGAGLLAGLGIALGFVLLIIPGLFLLTIWSMIVPSIVLEGKGAMESFGRSRELVRGNGWNVFGTIVITVLALIVGSIIVGIATFWLPDGVDAFISDVITGTVVAPFAAVAWTLMYFQLARGETATASPTSPAEPYAPTAPPA